jgi:hypothetical protein
VTFNGEKRKTKAIKRGGQHPEWDEEVRFDLYEDVEDEVDRTANDTDTPPPPPPKNNKGPRKIKGGRSMILSCYADDPREPDFIGEVTVDLTEVLTKGETDGELFFLTTWDLGLTYPTDWFTLMNKDKYCGEVYLELTFWLNVCNSHFYYFNAFLSNPMFRRNRQKRRFRSLYLITSNMEDLARLCL